ncbi:hypothetical protein [Thermosphaera sp.]
MKYHKLACWWIDLGIEMAQRTATNPRESFDIRERCQRQVEALKRSRDVLVRDSERLEREQEQSAYNGCPRPGGTE